MSDSKYRLSHQEGQFLMRYASILRVPSKIGDEEFSLPIRTMADDSLRSLRGALKTYSPLTVSERKVIFGTPSNWHQTDESNWKQIDPDLRIEVRLDEDAVDGAYYCLLFALHPDSESKVTLGEAGDIIWPLAEQLGLRTALRNALKLNAFKHRVVRDEPIKE
jgi:hypothetical protein